MDDDDIDRISFELVGHLLCPVLLGGGQGAGKNEGKIIGLSSDLNQGVWINTA